MTRGTRLELTWVGKYEQPRLEPRILLEDETKSYCAKERVTEHDRFDNLLIKGDNLLALKALEHQYAGKVKCIYIDPPYNTGSAFTHYDDGMEHSLWLTMMRDRLVMLRQLLLSSGTIWISVDDNEAHYLKVMMDEVFGRSNFVATFVWQKTLTRRNDARLVSVAHDYVVVYAKDADAVRINRVGSDEKRRSTYTNRDEDPRGDWLAVPFHAPNIRPNLTYPITTPGGKVLLPPAGRCWSTTKEKYEELLADNRIYFGKDGRGMAQRKKFWAESDDSQVAWTWWPYEETGENREANREAKDLATIAGIQAVFSTPKPERLLHRVIQLATNPGDLVLDSFAGSGTTGAVAHKMGRRWIMVELGDHCDTHIVPRLHKVIDGADPGGVTETTGWKGGGGFRYCTLAPSLLAQDDRGNWVISKQYNAAMLAQAVCVHEGFVYAPSREHYWLHGVHRDSANTFLWVTTQTLTRERLERLSTEVGEGRHLMVCCLAFKGDPGGFPNLVVKKLPTSILDRCEWGKDDYSLKIAALGAAPEPEPAAADDTAPAATAAPAAAKKKGKKPKEPAPDEQQSLFGGGDKKGG